MLPLQIDVYHRLESRTQAPVDAQLITRSGELWGRVPSWGGSTPYVKAYRGSLPSGARGIQFTTPISPDPGGSPIAATWTPVRLGVSLHLVHGVEYAVLRPVTVVLNTQI